MIHVVMKTENNSIYNVLKQAVQENISTTYLSESRLIGNKKNSDLIFYNLPNLEQINCDKTLLILDHLKNCEIRCASSCRVIAVVNSNNTEALQTASALKIPAVTCGMQSKDTITLSSITQESAVLSIQRSIVTFDNTVIEPSEIPLTLHSSLDNFTILAVCAILILSGNFSLLQNISL